MSWRDAPIVQDEPLPVKQPDAQPRMQKIADFAAETDRLLGLTPGTSLAQLKVESNLRDTATSPKGAMGVAQVMPETLSGIERRVGRKLDPRNTDDALLIHREVMQENMNKFGNEADALKAYNGGWNPNRWNNPETSQYVQKISATRDGKSAAWMTAPAVGNQYKPFAVVRKDIDPKSLNTDQDWLNASRRMYEMWERKAFEGTDEELAEWGKVSMANFNYNMVSMAQIANAVTGSTQEDKEAFLWMMDTFDNTKMSWEGTKRAVAGFVTDPFTYVGLGTLGIGFAFKESGKQATKQGIKQLVMRSLGRTGITAGVEGGVYAGTQSTVEQGIEVSAGRRDEISVGKTAADTAVGVAAGVVLGTTADAALSKITDTIKNILPSSPKSENPKTGTTTPKTEVSTPTTKTIDEVATEATESATNPKIPQTLDDVATRQQAGRLRADEAVPPISQDAPKVEVPEINTGGRTTRLTDEPAAKIGDVELDNLASKVEKQLATVETKDLPSVLENLRTGSWTAEQWQVINRAFQNFSFSIKKDMVLLAQEQKKLLAKSSLNEAETARLAEVGKKLAELEERSIAPQLADDAAGSLAGKMLQDRQGPMGRVRNLTPEQIAAEKGIPLEQAEKEYADLIIAASKDADAQKVAAEYAPKIDAALKAGDFAEATRLAQEKSRAIDAITGEMVQGSSTWMAKATEWAISNVFTVKTLFVNLIPSGIKTIMIPAIKAIVNNPLEAATRAEFSASYSAMRATFKSAMKAAAEAYKYEQAFLTRDANRILETGMAIKGKFGGAVRLFPRLLNASDEFLSQINYAAYVAGRAAAEATVEGSNKGLKGKALNEYVEKAVETARKASFEGNTGDDLINPIISKGMNLGYTGDALFKYVEKEMASNGPILKALGYEAKDLSVLQRGTDEEAINFVRDVLYKKDFSGKGAASKAANWVDDGLRKFPSLKLITGQLFFRTPVRVFEEGMRLTPGVQILAPNFIKDLKGANGTLRQVRAQGEALASLSMAGMILSLYAQGRITGDGAYDNYHQQKNRGDGALQEPYTIRFSDGSTWSYRNFDPIATPMKMIVNALERYDKLRIKEAQGEFIDAGAFEKPLALITVASGAMTRAFIDAGLTEGINQMGKIWDIMSDPQANDDWALKYVADKMNLVVPNTLKKIARDNDPTIKDPATFWQVVEQKLLGPFPGVLGGDQKLTTSNSYDALGNVRQYADTAYAMDFFTTNSVEERSRGMSEESLFVLQELDRLARTTGFTLKSNPKVADLGGLDTRTVMSSDGKRTLFDVWQQNYKELNPTDALYPVLSAELPDGTFKYKGARVEAAREVYNKLQKAAFELMMIEEDKVLNKYIDEKIKKAGSQGGLFDTPRPY